MPAPTREDLARSGTLDELYSKIASKVFDVFTDYCKQQGFTVVLDGTAGQQQPPVVLYAIPSVDISKAIIDAYNVKSGVPAPPPQPPSAPTPKPAPRTPPAAH